MAGSKITQAEFQRRVKDCYVQRFESDDRIGVKQWIQHCHSEYGDKSEQQYTAYWMQAGKDYDEGWQLRLNKLLGPAVDKIMENLDHPNPKVRADAIAKVFKYTGHDITKTEIKGTIETIQVGFGKND